VSIRNGELIGDRAIEDLPSRFDSHLRIPVESKRPLLAFNHPNVGARQMLTRPRV
jgi:hypothetical protein